MNLPITPTRSDRRCWLGLVALPAAMAVFMATVQAQDAFPTRAITILVPYSAGGPTDQVARQFAVELGKAMGQPVVVENRTGASGLLAMQALARAPADGYLVGMMATPVTAIAPMTQPSFTQDTVKDWQPIGDVVNYALVLMTGKHVPAKTVSELVTHAKANPKAVSYGSSGVGGTNHLAGELLARESQSPMLHVPYKGNAPAATDAMGGQISFVFDMPNTAQAYAKAGKLTPLAITSAKRNPMLPDVPTMAESGYPGVQVEGWYGLIGPAKIPPAVLAKWEQATAQVKRNASFRQQMQTGGFVVTEPGSGEDFRRRIAKERDFWQHLITSAKIQLQ